MNRAIWLLLSIAASGCEDRGAKFSKAEIEQLNLAAEQFRAKNPGVTKSCLEAMRAGEGPAFPTPKDGCFEMQPAKRWHGLWNSGWEWTNFCPSPARDCPIAAERDDTWLEFADGVSPRPEPNDGLYEIEFIGRRTSVPGHFGHLDQYDHAMIVDRLISIWPVEVPWPAEKNTRNHVGPG